MRSRKQLVLAGFIGFMSLGGGAALGHGPTAPVVVAPPPQLLVPSQYPTIQAAVNAAVNGTTIVVSPGTYAPVTITNTVGLTLQGSPGAVIDGGATRPAITVTGSGNLDIQGFTVSSGLDAVSLTKTTGIVQNLTVTSAGSNGIHAVDTNLTVNNVSVSHTAGSAIRLENPTMIGGQATVTNSTIEWAGQWGVYVTRSDIGDPVTITNNRIANTGSDGVHIESGSVVGVSGNEIEGAKGDAILIQECHESCGVTENTVLNTTGAGLRIEGAPVAEVVGNMIATTQSDGIVVGSPNVSIRDNDVFGVAGNGIDVTEVGGAAIGGTGSYDGETISDNVVSRTGGDGILVTAGVGIQLAGNQVSSTGDCGIRVSGSQLDLIANQVSQTACDGISIANAGGDHDLTLVDNQVDGSTRFGVNLGSADDVFLTRNLVTNAGDSGFRIDDGADRNVFKGNKATGSGEWDLFEADTAGKNTIAKSNKFAKKHRKSKKRH